MKIHSVQQGDTLYSIAQRYGTSVNRLETDNNITSNTNLSIGQAIIISEPEQTYTVQENDTLQGIAEMFGIPVTQLLRYNPNISTRENFNLFPGEELVISYKTTNRAIKVNGFTTTYISNEVLQLTLPSLTYITIMGHSISLNGDIEDIDDNAIINKAIAFRVAPIIFLSSMDTKGRGNYAISHSILTNEAIQFNFINNVFNIMKAKGYYGLNMGFYYMAEEDLPLYVELIGRIFRRAKNEGYIVFVTCIPETFRFNPNISYPYSYFHDIGLVTDYVILASFLWPSATLQQYAETTPYFLKQYLDYVITQIPSNQIFLGLSRIAYDFALPYIENESFVSSLTNAAAVNMANELLVPIQFDEVTRTPYFYYNNAGVEYFVWYSDSRTYTALLNYINEYELAGISVWNILYYHTQTWVGINAQNAIIDFETNNPSVS